MLQAYREMQLIFSSAVTPKSVVVEHDTIMLQPDDWEISPEGIVMDEKLGEGAFGEVYKGIVAETYNNPRIEGFLKKNSNGYVAVKFLKGKSQFMNLVMHSCYALSSNMSTCCVHTHRWCIWN